MPFDTSSMPDDVRDDYNRQSHGGTTIPAALLGGASDPHSADQLAEVQKAREGIGLAPLSPLEQYGFTHGTPGADQVQDHARDHDDFAMDAPGGRFGGPSQQIIAPDSSRSFGPGFGGFLAPTSTSAPSLVPGSGSSIQIMSDGPGPSPGAPAGLVDVFRQMQNGDDSGRTNTALVVDLWCLMDGAGSVITTGTRKAWGRVLFPCKLIGWTLLADPSGNVTVDVQKCDYSSFPSFSSITSATPPSISAGQKNTAALGASDWTVTLSRGDIIRVDLTTNSAATLILLDLYAVRTDASDKTTN